MLLGLHDKFALLARQVLTAENLWKGVFEGPNAEAFKSLVFHRLRKAAAAAAEV